jgi:hypothetical protein
MKHWSIGALIALLLPVTMEGQAVEPHGRFEVAVGGLWAAPVSMGAADATETTPNGPPFRLFSSESSFASAIGLEGRIGVRVGRGLQVEGSATYGTPTLRTRIRSDAEGIPDITLTETVNRWTIEAALVASLLRWRFGTRSVPFLSAGAGYLREVHEGAALVETGLIYQGGGGLNILLTQHTGERRLKNAGVRVGMRAAVRSGGGILESPVRVSPVADVSVFLRY